MKPNKETTPITNRIENTKWKKGLCRVCNKEVRNRSMCLGFCTYVGNNCYITKTGMYTKSSREDIESRYERNKQRISKDNLLRRKRKPKVGNIIRVISK